MPASNPNQGQRQQLAVCISRTYTVLNFQSWYRFPVSQSLLLKVGGRMPFMLKLFITNLIIIGCVLLGRKLPFLAGLIATMPITTLAVLLWLHSENSTDPHLLTDYTRGVLWGIIPTTLFFAATLACLKRGMPLPACLAVSGAVWLASAGVHQWLLR